MYAWQMHCVGYCRPIQIDKNTYCIVGLQSCINVCVKARRIVACVGMFEITKTVAQEDCIGEASDVATLSCIMVQCVADSWKHSHIMLKCQGIAGKKSPSRQLQPNSLSVWVERVYPRAVVEQDPHSQCCAADNSSLYLNNTVCNNNMGAQGGCLAAANAYDMALVNVLMRNNTAENGGGVYVSGCHDMVVYNASMSSNNATVSGGGIFQVSPAAVHVNSNQASLV